MKRKKANSLENISVLDWQNNTYKLKRAISFFRDIKRSCRKCYKFQDVPLSGLSAYIVNLRGEGGGCWGEGHTFGCSISGSLWTSLTSSLLKASSRASSIASLSSDAVGRCSLDVVVTVRFSKSSLSLTTTRWMSFPAFFKTWTASWWVAVEISTPLT